MNLPNKLTILRVIMIPLFLLILLTNWLPDPQKRIIAVIIFALASFTDYLDGYIARKNNLVTNFGKFMDPLADKLLVTSALISLVELGDLSAWIAILIISREFIITGFRLIAASDGIVIAASWWGKIKTVSQMLMIIIVLLNINTTLFNYLEYLLMGAVILFTIISCIDYIAKNIKVLKE
ncbi:MAG: CDP-diacylglycerol--glycerol-3-phosphate 3-phosphatidyltransferase [Epulopiscium sp.]|nr:CDP-diacylglycerol--glycerol-3-phosphate 3-phosphatidyltransferase [Candidatus Epulonipiscium sp.]HOQ16252.1 CDP-diacylglycerol--glycerol-3-phosphate 3-phosphatidyltransferase [Defluviitaleaceae bacterium]HPT75291.1 CDP-diacylglycerol--glycerol-3-phosphate 3-phosphatidyltransferase [Defluviitaleaceae bacterium]